MSKKDDITSKRSTAQSRLGCQLTIVSGAAGAVAGAGVALSGELFHGGSCDRAEAILAGVDALQPGDALLIAGKGHETGQIVAGDVLPFDDVEHARAAIGVLDRGELSP